MSQSIMEAEIYSANQKLGIHSRLYQAVGPVLLISMGYVDVGKWAAAVEGGARFGFDLVLFMLVFNLAAILFHYLAVRIGVVTGRNLAQICSEEYGQSTCILLGVQAELSTIALELMMILGIAHSLNLIFGADLLTCVLLSAIDAVLYPLFTTLLEDQKANFLCIIISGLTLLVYVLGVLISQAEMPHFTNGMLTKLSGESAFTLMSLLGASIMPHNFYLHSSVVRLQPGVPNVSKGALCHDQFFAILCVFSGIFLVNYALVNSAVSVFHSSGLVLLTFQDVLLLMDQVFKSPVAPFVFFLVMFFSCQITALTSSLSGQVVLHDFFRMDPPVWIHRVTIRILAIVPALYCVWASGAEGVYQLLIFTQVILAMLLPSSVIPLFRVASTRSIMGDYKISQFMEFLVLITFIGMLGLNIIFVVEMMFGSSDWVGNLRWNMGSSMVPNYAVLLTTACASLGLMLWLAAMPLKSASVRQDAQAWNWDFPRTIPQSSGEGEKSDLSKTGHVAEPIAGVVLDKSIESRSDNSVAEFDLNLPETILDSDQELHQTTVEEICTGPIAGSSSTCRLEEPTPTSVSSTGPIIANKVADVGLRDTSSIQNITRMDSVEKAVGEGDLQTEKDDDDGDNWEPEESSKGVSESGPSSISEGPGSFRSLSGKSDEGGLGNGAGSLSRLSGLGRAARRHLATVLEEFWGQLYDYHGQATQEAKTKKLDALLGLDPISPSSPLRVDLPGTKFSGFYPSVAGRGSDSKINSSIYDSPKQQGIPSSLESTYGVQTGASSSWSSHMRLLDAYVKTSNCNVLDSGERRYSSLRLPPSSESCDNQPATVHGYQIASYLNRLGADGNSDPLSTPLEFQAPNSPSFVPADYRDSLSYAMGQKPQNGLSSILTMGAQNAAASRNSRLQAGGPYYDFCSSGAGESVGSPAYAKKYHSLPDISGLAIPHQDSYSSNRSALWGSPIGYNPSVGRKNIDQSLYSNTISREGVPLAFDELSPSKVYRDVFPAQLSSNSDTRSLWSRQPFEQLFGVAGKPHGVGIERAGSGPSLIFPEAVSHIDLEAKLLQSFRYCIVKLLKLEGSDWLFRQNDGTDEDLIDRVAARERFHYEAETREVNKFSSSMKSEEARLARFPVSSVPNCGEGCIWRADLIVSFGVWCIHRILELSQLESRPELWGKYTYVLNRLQGILDPAFSKPRSPLTPCFCLQVPVAQQRRSSPPVSNGILPPASKPGRGKCTTATVVLDLIKDVEIAISYRKGRTGTAAGDVAFPKGKENLASVLKRYKRRLANKAAAGTHEGGSGSRKPVPSYGS